jgi:ribosome-associated toxin RatA of RatAB toxin-antitoxin module
VQTKWHETEIGSSAPKTSLRSRLFTPGARTFRKRGWYVLASAILGIVVGCSTQYRVTSTRYAEFEGEINQHSRLIRASARELFEVVTVEARFQSILPQGTVLTHETAPPYQAGSRVCMHINHIFKLKWTSQVEEVVPDKKIRLTFLDGFFAGGTEIWEFDVEPGGTRATHTIIVNPNGFWRKLAWNLKVRLKHDTMVEQMLDNLARLAERQSA